MCFTNLAGLRFSAQTLQPIQKKIQKQVQTIQIQIQSPATIRQDMGLQLYGQTLHATGYMSHTLHAIQMLLDCTFQFTVSTYQHVN